MALRVTWLAVALALAATVTGAKRGRVYAQWTERVSVQHAAYSVSKAPSALVHAGAGFDPARPLHIVVYLHGYMGCAEVLMGEGNVACKPGEPLLRGWDLARIHDSAGANTLFVIPQLAFMKRNGRPGCFGRSGCFRAFIAEVLAALPSARLSGKKTMADVAALTLIAHSAGYRATLAILEYGGVQSLVREVVLFDALYAGSERFLAWIAGAGSRQRHLVCLHTGAGAPALRSAQLLRAARRALGAASVAQLDAQVDEPSFGEAMLGKRLVVARVKVPHRQVPAAYLGRVLRALEATR